MFGCPWAQEGTAAEYVLIVKRGGLVVSTRRQREAGGAGAGAGAPLRRLEERASFGTAAVGPARQCPPRYPPHAQTNAS